MRRILSLVIPLLLAAPTSTQAGQPIGGQTYVPGEVIVKLKNGDSGVIGALSQNIQVLPAYQILLSRLKARHGLEEGMPIGSPTCREPCYVLKTNRDVLAACRELNADPEVEYAQPNYIYRPCREPNDPDFADQYAHQLIQMQDAWDISTGSRDIVIAILGTGVDVNHPDLKQNIWVNKDEIAGNGIDDDQNGYVDDLYGWNFGNSNNNVVPKASLYSSTANHETQVAGVVAALGNNGQGVVGVNWQCSIMVLRVSLSFTSKEVAAALDYAAANGARVVNMSFGGDSFGPEGDRLVKAAIDNAYAKGVLLVASAGNSDSSRPHYPAAYYNVMAVASTNAEDKKTGHSTFGAWVDIAAPGTDIVTTDLGGKYIATAGTSFSSPYVAAVATLVLAHRPQLTPIEVRALLENTADPLDYGDLDPNLCYIGTGRVNAFKALEGADRAYPLGEIVSPGARQTYAADGNAIALCLFVHGDSYQIDYRGYDQRDWKAVAQGVAPKDPNGFAYISLANPGVGTYELRLRVTRGEYTHTDGKMFAVQKAADEAHWPRPDSAIDSHEYFLGSPLCLDLNGDGRSEILQASADMADFLGGGRVNIWDANGNSLPHWPVKIDGAWPTSAAVGDIDGDGDYEVVVACEFEGEVYAYHSESGRSVKGRWPAAVGGWYGWIPPGPVLADLDGDGANEILIALDMESADTDGLIAIRADGTLLWQRRYTSAGPISAADLNKDGHVEIVLSGYGPGLSRFYTFILDEQGQLIAKWTGGSPLGTAVADLDADGKFEVVFCTDKEVVAGRPNGSTVWKTKVPDPLDVGGGLCVGDLNGDGLSEVYVATAVEEDEFLFSRVYAFDHKGHALATGGFPKTIMGDPTRCVPLSADIDGDGKKELVVGSAGEPIMAWEADGSVTPGFPMLSLVPDLECTPALADLDRDGALEIMVADDDYRFHVMDMAVPYVAEKMDWSMVRHDPQNSGWAAAAPRIGSFPVPAQIKPGQQLTFELSASNPANLPLHWRVGTRPDGAHYDANSLTVSWQPRLDQAFQTGTFAFTVTDGVRQDSRMIPVEVTSDAIYQTSMDADPNWTLDSYWSWGVPTIRAGSAKKYDPESGRTGGNVIGCALHGNYLSNIADTRYATTPPIDCRGFQNIRLSFWRWLTIDSPKDRVCLQVSTDGVNWTDLWAPDQSPILDETWKFVEYAVPAGLADNQPAVYFRWGLGPTNASVTYGGWNIDDVQVTGDKAAN